MTEIKTIDDLIDYLRHHYDSCVGEESPPYGDALEKVQELKANMEKKEAENIKHLCLTCNQIRKHLEENP